MPAVDHVFVLMLENRSFDHFFGLSGRAGIPRPTDAGFGPGATDRAQDDPHHEFPDVQVQIADGAMTGFAPPWTKLAFTPDQIPVVSQLADEFVLFDNWFASIPGPTWPNRFFVHAASSGGLATSPTQLQSAGSVILTSSFFNFQNGTIYDRLDAASLKWRVYHGDVHPQMLSLPGMVRRYLSPGDNFCQTYALDPGFSSFADDVSRADYAPAYTFIEPNYAVQLFSEFKGGDSQHALGSVSAGEVLIKDVYEALRTSPLWPRSVLLVTWDEHGGFYDHVPPPAAKPPGDAPLNRASKNDPGFAFDRLGVRVPALLISPRVPQGRLGSELFPGRCFDHSSVIKSVFENFGLGAPLTARDDAAPSWNGCIAAAARAAAAPEVLKAPAQIAAPLNLQVRAPAPVSTEVDGFLAGNALIALELDRVMAEQSGHPAIANLQPQSTRDYQRSRSAALADPHFRLRVSQYVNEVAVRVRAQRMRARLR